MEYIVCVYWGKGHRRGWEEEMVLRDEMWGWLKFRDIREVE